MKDINEKRKNFVKLVAQYNRNGKEFCINEGVVTPIQDLNEGLVDPIENYNEEYDIISEMQAKAARAASATDISYFMNIPYFQTCGYTFYIYDDKILYRDSESFNQLIYDIENNNLYKDSLLYKNINEPIDYIELSDTESALDVIDTLIKCSGMNENIKVKVAPMSTNGNRKESFLYNEAKHGQKDINDFEEEVEKITQEAGVDNPIAPLQQQESVNIFPNAHMLQESKSSKKDAVEIEYEVGDWVIINETGIKAQVCNIVTNSDGKITMFTIIGSDGFIYDIEDFKEIAPDPLYMQNVPGRVVNSQILVVPERAKFNIDPKTRMSMPYKNEELPDDYHKDLNGRFVPVYVLKDGRRMTTDPYQGFLEDIIKSKTKIRVLDEEENVQEYDVNKDLEFTEMPYAVVVNAEDKPVRSIQIDPKSFVNADEDGLVDCAVDGKMTKFPKSRIKTIV